MTDRKAAIIRPPEEQGIYTAIMSKELQQKQRLILSLKPHFQTVG
ncbi:putative adhesin MafB, truncated [Neisseria meningitidis]|nr:putative adhesin MafB, truncated [Neisseria meningitidis]